MTTAPNPDPFEDREWFNHAISDVFVDSPFGFTDPDVVENEIMRLRSWLNNTPNGEEPSA